MFFVLNFSSPLTLLVRILRQTLAICFLGWLISNSRWFAFILFIIYLGGLIVLFVYIVRLASNEKLFFKTNFFILATSSIFFILFLFFSKINFLDLRIIKNNFSINFYFIFSNYRLILIVPRILYLLFSLIVIIKICNKFNGPLKSY